MKTRAELKYDAKNQMKDGMMWWVLLVVIITDILLAVANFASIIVVGPLFIGLSTYLLKINEKPKENKEKIELIFTGFTDNFIKNLLIGLLQFIFILLWTLLFIIPGIIKALAYSQTFFIAAENKDLEHMDVLRASEKMMLGHKWRLFVLLLSFLGWIILVPFTFGLLLIWLIPYMQLTMLNFYLDLRGEVTISNSNQEEVVATIE